MARDVRGAKSEPGGGPAAAQAAEPPVRRSWWGQLWHEWVRPLLVVAAALLSFRSSIVDWNDVPSGSMKPTILEGDRVFVNKLAYDFKLPFVTRGDDGRYSVWDGGHTLALWRWAHPRRGDIVVLWSPADGRRLVKRIVGVPGDELEVRRHRLVVNGVPAQYAPLDPQVLADAGIHEPQRELNALETVAGRTHAVIAATAYTERASWGPVKLAEGMYYVMGDHRDDSNDSRFFGPIDRRRIVGRATRVVVSADILNGWRPRWGRFFKRLD